MKNLFAPLGALSLLCCVAIPAAADINLSSGTYTYTVTFDNNGNGDQNAPPSFTAPTVTTLASGWVTGLTDGIGDSGQWIAPNANQSNVLRNSADGYTVYDLTFSLVGFNASTAVLTMNLAADDYVGVTLNGTPIFTPTASQVANGMWTAASGAFSINDTGSVFNSGSNTLEFTVPNFVADGADSCCYPTGLDVAASVSASPATVPEPSSALPLGLAVAGAAYLLRRRVQSLR